MTARSGRAATTGRRRAAALGLALVAGLAVTVPGAVVTAVPAGAHNVVVGTQPAASSTVTDAPGTVEVTFDDVVLDLSAEGSSTVVTVTDESGTDHATGCPTTQDRTVSVPVALGAPGEYTVDWRIVSADGHPTSGEFTFTYDPPAGASSPSPALDAPPCGTASTGEAADDAAAGGGQAGGATVTAGSTVGASDLVVVLGVAGGVVVLAGLGVLVALRLARRGD